MMRAFGQKAHRPTQADAGAGPSSSLALAILVIACSVATTAFAEPARAPATEDYARAERLLPHFTAPLLMHVVEHSSWLPEGRLTYQTRTASGTARYIVDPKRGTRRPASVSGGLVSSPLRSHGSVSPDGTRAVFIRNHNLWMREVASGTETQLTTDGVQDFAYATNNSGRLHNDHPLVPWSPDSKRIATFQQDQRGVGEMYLVQTDRRQKLKAWKYPWPEMLSYRASRESFWMWTRAG